MRVTVVPADKLIIVNNVTHFFAFDAPENMHALQWAGESGHIEWMDGPNTALSDEDYEEKVAPYVALWQAEHGRLVAEAKAAAAEYDRLENVKARKLVAIDKETSESILSGFECEATPPDTGIPEQLHFSYDGFDQQNFADAALSMQLSAADDPEGMIPTSTPWNAYRGHTKDDRGELVILHLSAETFLPIYSAALTHKATKMAEGGRRKAAVAVATTREEVEAI